MSKYKGKMFIELGYSNLYELFLENKELNILSKCKNTLFIFEEITWQCLQILFFTLNIRLSGGSHTKRHLISPLDIRLLDSIELLKRYVIELLYYNPQLDLIGEYSSKNTEYKAMLERLVIHSYHSKDTLKSLELKSAYKKFFIINKLLGVNPVDRKDLPIRRQEA